MQWNMTRKHFIQTTQHHLHTCSVSIMPHIWLIVYEHYTHDKTYTGWITNKWFVWDSWWLQLSKWRCLRWTCYWGNCSDWHGCRDMKMTQSTAVRHPQQLPTGAAEMHWRPSVESDVPVHWQTHPGCTSCLYLTQFRASMVARSVI